MVLGYLNFISKFSYRLFSYYPYLLLSNTELLDARIAAARIFSSIDRQIQQTGEPAVYDNIKNKDDNIHK